MSKAEYVVLAYMFAHILFSLHLGDAYPSGMWCIETDETNIVKTCFTIMLNEIYYR